MSLDVDLILDDLESRWNQSAEVDITEFLSEYGIHAQLQQLPLEQRDLLFEAVQIDIERRCMANGRIPLLAIAEYLQRYPSLNTDLYRKQLHEFEARLQSRTKQSDSEIKSETFYEPSTESSSAPSGQEFAEGEIFGPYRIIRKIGEGGMGTVYRAVHSHLGKTVALKLLSPRLMHDAEVISRFRREMRAAGQIDHPHVVRAMDAGEINQRHFLVTEFVDGKDLTSLVRQHGTMSVDETCRIIAQAASALSAAHQHGMVHRDIKPSNLMLTKSGDVKLLDLGLMRLTSDESGEATDFTTAGTMFGTPDYMAPEQWEDARNVDQRTDLYALGCTLFFLLVGRAPYSSDRTRSVYSKMRAHTESEIPDLCQIRPDVNSTVGFAFQRLMAKRPEDRFASAEELIAYLANRRGAVAGQRALPFSQTGEPARTIVMSGQPIDSESATHIDLPSNACMESRPSWLRSRSRVWLTGLAAVVLVSGVVWKFLPASKPMETASSTTVTPDHGSLPSSVKPSTANAANPVDSIQLEFDGFDDRVDIPQFEFDWSQPFTWEAEIQVHPDKPRITNDNPSFADPIFRHGNNEITGFSVLYDRTASHWFIIHRPSLKNPADFYSVPCQVMGQRLHLAVTYTGKELKLYANGEAQPLRLIPGLTESPPSPDADLESYGSAPVAIGEDLYLAKNVHRWFRGRIGYLCLSKGLNDLKAFSLETRTEANPEAELQYLFSQDQQLKLLDSSGHGRHGRIRGAVWVAKSDNVEVPQPVTPQPTPSLPDPDRIAAEWVISHGGNVTLVEGGKVAQQMGDLPPDPYQIRAVEIRNVDHFTEDDGQRLARLRELSSISFVDTTHSPGSIKVLSRCSRLESMGLHGGNSNDATLSEILHVQKLRSIVFINTGVKDELVSRLGQLQQLLGIHCYVCPGLTEDGLVRLAAAAPPKLQSLYLGMNSFSERGMKAIASLPHLQTFNLKVATLDRTAVAGLAGSSSVADVWLRCEGTFSSADTTALQNTLQGCQISTSNPDLAPALYTTPAYRHAILQLRSRGYGIAISYFDTIRDKSQWFDNHNPSLPETVIYAKMLASQNPWETNTRAMDDVEFEQLANLTDLQGITFGKLPSDGLLKFLPLKNLTSLEIIQSPLTEKDIELLPAFSKLSTVSAVLPHDKSLETISKLPHLSHLIIGHQSEITDGGLKVLESASVLSTLNLQYSKVSREAAQAFANARPDVIVYFRGVRLDTEAK